MLFAIINQSFLGTFRLANSGSLFASTLRFSFINWNPFPLLAHFGSRALLRLAMPTRCSRRRAILLRAKSRRLKHKLAAAIARMSAASMDFIRERRQQQLELQELQHQLHQLRPHESTAVFSSLGLVGQRSVPERTMFQPWLWVLKRGDSEPWDFSPGESVPRRTIAPTVGWRIPEPWTAGE